jgi:putative aminopeptidase FrvX
MPIDEAVRSEHERWLLELSQIPTATGREQRVVSWIERWVAERDDLVIDADTHGNLVVRAREPWGDGRPIYITAHLDHPAFVVDRVLAPGTVQLEFRGGVMDEYFEEADIVVHTRGDERLHARVVRKLEGEQAGLKLFEAELDAESGAVSVGDVGTWKLPEPEVVDGVLHTNVCDDLAAAAAALSAFDVLRGLDGDRHDVRLLFTRAEEIGFIGAIGACKDKTMPMDARVIALENSRAFADSPIGGGPIVRVGDRMSVFSPSLTSAIAKRAEDVSGGSAHVLSVQKQGDAPEWKWQRKLMAGGACEASVFCAYGYEATCLCLPLGNYHNMGDLDAVQAETNTTRPRVGREYISLSDYRGLVDLLVACGTELPERAPLMDRLEKLFGDRAGVLGES